MDKIKVSKQTLIDKLKENKETHIIEFEKMYDEYQKEVIVELSKLLKVAKKTERFTEIKAKIYLAPPTSYVDDYQTAIDMLEFSIDSEIYITQREFEQYVQNKWSWSGTFELSKTMYLKD